MAVKDTPEQWGGEGGRIKNKNNSWNSEKVLEMDSGDRCTTMQIYLMPLNCILKNGTFYVYFTIKRKSLRRDPVYLD